VRSAVAWWRGLSDTDRYRFYTRVTLQVAVVIPVVVIAGDAPVWAVAGVVLAGVGALLAAEGQPVLSVWQRDGRPPVPVWAGPALLVAVLAAAVVVARLVGGETAVAGARGTAVVAGFFLALCVVPFLRRPWLLLVAGSALVAVSLATTWEELARIAAGGLALGVFATSITLLSWWGLRVLDDLEHAREVEGELKVAEERLRFARDLHDVVGRGFSAVAVKSELAATLARAGHADRAAAEMDEVKQLAVESMDQMRDLVRGYRDISLAAEVAGARSLLAAAGCRLDVEGAAERVPANVHEAAAWVVREGTTNVVKHSAATWARLSLGPDGMSLRNDAPRPQVDGPQGDGERSGLRGLAERLAAVGATITSTRSDGEYLLEVRWEQA
jgi:two-component system sensor histidine kinase DesK